MKVKITYTVDLSDVPSKTDPLFDIAATSAKDISDRLASLKKMKNNSIEKCLKEISEIRKGLMNVDLALDDCDEMLVGYLRTMTDSPSYPEVPDTEEVSENG